MAIRTRVGQGFDIHRFVDGPSDRVLVLGGVKFPNEKPLAGHSDADVIAHAAADALLGAASLGDIGMHFPDTDPKWEGADSIGLLTEVARLVRASGFEPGNVDAAVVCERPKLAPRAQEMGDRLSQAVDAPVTAEDQLGARLHAGDQVACLAVHQLTVRERDRAPPLFRRGDAAKIAMRPHFGHHRRGRPGRSRRPYRALAPLRCS